MAFVKIVPENQATGLTKQEYERGIKRAGYISQAVKVSSMAPEFLKSGIDFYVSLIHKPSQIPRVLKEMIGVVVSKVNQCHY